MAQAPWPELTAEMNDPLGSFRNRLSHLAASPSPCIVSPAGTMDYPAVLAAVQSGPASWDGNPTMSAIAQIVAYGQRGNVSEAAFLVQRGLAIAAATGIESDDQIGIGYPPGSAAGRVILAAALWSGASIIGADPALGVDPDLLVHDTLGHAGITALFAAPVPILRAAHGDLTAAGLRLLVVAGDYLGRASAHSIAYAVGPSVRTLFGWGGSASGPLALLTSFDDGIDDVEPNVAAGQPVAGVQAAVLDSAGNECAAWVPGMINYVLGAPGEGGRAERGEYGRRRPDGCIIVDALDSLSGAEASSADNTFRLVETAAEEASSVLAAVLIAGRAGTALVLEPAHGATIDLEEIAATLGSRVSPLQLPDRMVVTTALPLSETGAVDRAALSAMAAGTAPGPATEVGGGAPAELSAQVCEIAARAINVRSVAPDADLFGLGATSVDIVRILAEVELHLGLVVDLDLFLREPTVGTIVREHGRAGSPGARMTGEGTRLAPDVLMVDLAEREAFKAQRIWRRADLDEAAAVPVTPPSDILRRSAHSYSTLPMSGEQLTAFLGILVEGDRSGLRARCYPSAGGSYPVRVYVVVGPDRVQDLPGGSYYLSPDSGALILIRQGHVLDESAHAYINARQASEAAARCSWSAATTPSSRCTARNPATIC